MDFCLVYFSDVLNLNVLFICLSFRFLLPLPYAFFHLFLYVLLYDWFVLVWFVGFYGISTFVGYFTPNPFLCK